MLAKCTRLGFPKLRPWEISRPSRATTCREAIGSSRAVFLARIFPSLVKALGFKGLDPDSGTSTPELLASYDRDSQSWKTSALSLFEGSIPYSGALPRSGTMRNGRIYAPPMSERPTDGNACGYLPTPCKSDGEHFGKEKWIFNSRAKRLSDGRAPPTEKATYLLLEANIPPKYWPEIYEDLMGYPRSWTDLNASGIALSLRSPSLSSEE
jgi:hypothetical protein